MARKPLKAIVMVLNRLAWLNQKRLVSRLQAHGWYSPNIDDIYRAVRKEANGILTIPPGCEGWPTREFYGKKWGRPHMDGKAARELALATLSETLAAEVGQALDGPRPLGEIDAEIATVEVEAARLVTRAGDLEKERELRKIILDGRGVG